MFICTESLVVALRSSRTRTYRAGSSLCHGACSRRHRRYVVCGRACYCRQCWSERSVERGVVMYDGRFLRLQNLSCLWAQGRIWHKFRCASITVLEAKPEPCSAARRSPVLLGSSSSAWRSTVMFSNPPSAWWSAISVETQLAYIVAGSAGIKAGSDARRSRHEEAVSFGARTKGRRTRQYWVLPSESWTRKSSKELRYSLSCLLRQLSAW